MWEVIVSDNGSTDESVKVVEAYRERLPDLRVVDSSDRRGPGHARNIGVMAATGDAVLFCDADDEVAPGWMAAMGQALYEHDFVACRLDAKKLNTPLQQESYWNSQEKGLINFHPRFLPFASGSSIGVKRSVHEAVGGFDESLIKFQDADYCWRIQLAGTKLHLVTNTVVYYRYRDSLRGMYKQMHRLGEYSVVLYKRYRPLGMSRVSQPWSRGLREWKRLLLGLLGVRHPVGRIRWVREFGFRIGRLKGSIKHRVLFL